MKKFLLGVLCGVVLSFTTAAAASNTVQAYLFPSRVTVDIGTGSKTIDGTGSNAVLNYNNKAYIPLRTFTDTMGYKLDYQPASASNGNKHQIQIFDPTFQQTLKWKDKDGYVSIGQFVGDDNRQLIGGIIQINKDMTGKQIDIIAKDAQGKTLAKSAWVYIDGEDRSLKAGQIRTFRAHSSNELRPVSFEVVVHDLLQPVSYNTLDESFDTKPFYASLVPNPWQESYQPGDIISRLFKFINTSSDELILDPTPLELRIYSRGNAQENFKVKDEYFKQTVMIQGKVASGSGYEVNFIWDQKDRNGKQVPPGEYALSVKLPDRITYVNARTKEKGQWVTDYQYFVPRAYLQTN